MLCRRVCLCGELDGIKGVWDKLLAYKPSYLSEQVEQLERDQEAKIQEATQKIINADKDRLSVRADDRVFVGLSDVRWTVPKTKHTVLWAMVKVARSS